MFCNGVDKVEMFVENALMMVASIAIILLSFMLFSGMV